MNEPEITIVGNLTADPELRYTPNGAAVASFTVASTPRSFSRDKGEYVDGTPLFMRGTVWRQQAENVAESLSKGQRVIVTGRLRQNNFEDKQGNKRSSIEMQVTDVGASLKFAGRKPAEPTGGVNDPWAPQSEDNPPF